MNSTLVCACSLFLGVTWILWPYMGIVTSHKSHGWNARFWLVEKTYAALWLVRTYSSHHYYCRPSLVFNNDTCASWYPLAKGSLLQRQSRYLLDSRTLPRTGGRTGRIPEMKLRKLLSCVVVKKCMVDVCNCNWLNRIYLYSQTNLIKERFASLDLKNRNFYIGNFDF